MVGKWHSKEDKTKHLSECDQENVSMKKFKKNIELTQK